MSGAELVRKSVDAFNKHDPQAWASFYATEAVVHDPQYDEALRGREAIQEDIATFFATFPDIHGAVRTTLEDGNVVATQWSLSGTNKGPVLTPAGEVPATGKAIKIEGAVFSRLNSDGQIIEERRYFDLADLLTQLGLNS